MADDYTLGKDGYVDEMRRGSEFPKHLFDGTDAAALKNESEYIGRSQR